MKKLFIFLDIDGVLNNYVTNHLVNEHIVNGKDVSKQVKFTNWLDNERGDFVDIGLLKNLHQLQLKYDSTSIIIISSWTSHYNHIVEKLKIDEADKYKMFSEFLEMNVIVAIENTCGDGVIRYKQSKQLKDCLEKSKGSDEYHYLYLDDIEVPKDVAIDDDIKIVDINGWYGFDVIKLNEANFLLERQIKMKDYQFWFESAVADVHEYLAAEHEMLDNALVVLPLRNVKSFVTWHILREIKKIQ